MATRKTSAKRTSLDHLARVVEHWIQRTEALEIKLEGKRDKEPPPGYKIFDSAKGYFFTYRELASQQAFRPRSFAI